MIRAGCQGLLHRQARLVGGVPGCLMRSLVSSRNIDSSFEEQTFSDLITQSGIYVNKIPKLLPLLKKQSGGIALTAPRRMGKTMNLRTIFLLKLLGVSDFIRVLDYHGYTEITKETKMALDSIIGKHNKDLYYHPKPVAILLPTGAYTQKLWVSQLIMAFQNSRDELKHFHEVLQKDEKDDQKSYSLRQAMIQEYQSAIQTPESLALFQRKGAILMIDEYDADYTSVSTSKSQKEFSKSNINRILANMKGKKCIVAGVYHPASIGFNMSTANSYTHYSTIMSSNDIAFTRKEVERYYSGIIQEAIDKLPKRKRAKLIKEIRVHFKFTEDEEEAKANQKVNRSPQRKGKGEQEPFKLMNVKFDEDKLVQYVIDVLFWMHDGFNLDPEKIPSETNLVLSPRVVLNAIRLLQQKEIKIFKWRDYMDSANHSRIRQFFKTAKQQSLLKTAKQTINTLMINGEIIVPQESLYYRTNSIEQLTPASIFFQEGLLSVHKDKPGQKKLLKIPNHGVKKFLLGLRGDLREEKSDFLAGLFDSGLSLEVRTKLVQPLILSTVDEVYEHAYEQRDSKQKLTEPMFTYHFADYFQTLFEEDSFKEIKFRHQYPQRKANKYLQKGRNHLIPDITIKYEGHQRMALIEIHKGHKEGKAEEKADKYLKLQKKKIGTVLVISYGGDDFKKVKQILVEQLTDEKK